MKKRISAILICTALLVSAFAGCGDGNDSCAEITTTAAPTTTQAETTTEAPTTTTTQAETTTASALKDGVYTTSLYSVAVPEGWICQGSDSFAMMIAPEPINGVQPNISVMAGSTDGDLSKMKWEDLQTTMEASMGKIEKISFGMKTFGENEGLFIEFSAEVAGVKQVMSFAVFNAGEQDITITLTRDIQETLSKEFETMLESLKITA